MKNMNDKLPIQREGNSYQDECSLCSVAIYDRRKSQPPAASHSPDNVYTPLFRVATISYN